MSLAQALEIIQSARGTATGEPFDAGLACGFTPLHLQTFFHAALQSRLTRPVRLHCGIFGDLIGNIEKFPAELHAGAVVIEWGDLDSRLAFRHLGGWRPAHMPDLVATFARRMEHLESAIRAAAARFPVAVLFPALRLPPAFFSVNARASAAALALEASVASAAARLAEVPGVSIVNRQELELRSAASERHDLKSELFSGFPFTRAHAEAAAG
ncbi:MAG TPA: hypothetical protein VMG40_04595, partial [Bryobacteraceae bacterium]|nr:hypothetical protein [Bryobacteraceae bacterium]